MSELTCPLCALPLSPVGEDEAACTSGHVFDAASLTLASDLAAARALWMAKRAMDDDAAGLSWRAGQPGTSSEKSAELTEEARAARDAAATLRVLAVAAQRRLDRLTPPLSGVRLASESPTDSSRTD